MYVGPETLMPVASALAAVVGVALVFWRRTVAALKTSVRFVARVFAGPAATEKAQRPKSSGRRRRARK